MKAISGKQVCRILVSKDWKLKRTIGLQLHLMGIAGIDESDL
jgi:hypothetical protein